MEQKISKKIFLVDDDSFSLNYYAQHLRNLGEEDILCFSDGNDCLNHLALGPDIIFLDYNMASLTGLEVLDKIKRYDPDIFVVMVSGQYDMQTALNTMKRGAFDYIIKGEQETEGITKVLRRIYEIQEELDQLQKGLIQRVKAMLKS